MIPALLFVSAALIVAGIAIWSTPAALVTAGLLLAALTLVFVYDWAPE